MSTDNCGWDDAQIAEALETSLSTVYRTRGQLVEEGLEAALARKTRSADLNPIEMAFSKLKALIRKAAARTYHELWQAVGHVCHLFTDEECYNFFKAAGYRTD